MHPDYFAADQLGRLSNCTNGGGGNMSPLSSQKERTTCQCWNVQSNAHEEK